ncbi:hypothetical protein A33Q_1080 [Indibacter alkaliphilus LW1]|uniref:CarboxypepD_reg-like domain-containing protein n=1 Tax=Indibacter alkaliphilus (strain CCUG 57479 / KCTC 22604 / LW1) TaxID=1189612 RepID=S2E1T1_INDAL|nr:DUF5686 family protein [Indibacter alkaliphilus]EOZ98426.1 hypothetical protein A33Q_1080 [Indibacter alkaliphilus LW1]
MVLKPNPSCTYIRLPIFLAVFFQAFFGLLSPILAQERTDFAKGRVLNSETKEPVPFAHVYFKGFENQGTVTDIRGEFKLIPNSETDSLVISHVGFKIQLLPISSIDASGSIYLFPKQIEMAEMIFLAGENPALNIIRSAIDNRKINDPENLNAYQYNAYNKLVFTLKEAEIGDTLSVKIDSALKGGHIFISESFSEITFKKPGNRNETIKSSKMSGIKSPVIALVSSTFQPFSLYEDHIIVFDIPYLNPLSKEGLRKYDYFLEDSIQNDSGTSFIISFQAQKGKGYLLGQGIMAVSSNLFALENMVFKSLENGGTLQFELQQKNKWDGKHWFPEQVNSKYLMADFDIEGRPLKLINQHFISGVRINHDLKTRTISPVAMIFDIQNEEFPMEDYRRDSLSEAESLTYKRFEELDDKTLERLKTFSQVMTQLSLGRIPLGPVDLLPNRLFRLNQHEGFALGLGISSNQKLSDWFRTEGYFRYGFRDRAWKYGGGIETLFLNRKDSRLMFYYSHDIVEIGHVPFIKSNSFSRSSDIFREFLAERMDQVERFSVSFSQIPLRNVKVSIASSLEDRVPLWVDHSAFTEEGNLTSLRAAEVGLNIRYNANEKLSKIGSGFLPGPPSYPIFNLHFSKAIPEILGSNVDFWKIALKVQHEWKKGVSLNRFLLSGMGAWGELLPPSYLNTGFGIRPQAQEISISLPGYLQTMRIYEFLSDRAIQSTYSHLTGPLLDHKAGWVGFAPQLNLIQSFAIGSLRDPILADNLGFKTLERGYLESGIELQNLVKYKSGFGYQGIGIGAFYRWGAYSNPAFKDNLLINLSLTTAF